MLNVSTEWQAASREQFRYQAYLKASLAVVSPGLREGADVTSTYTYSQSDPQAIMDGIDFDPTKKFVTLECNRWLLDGSQTLLPPETVLQDWWSKNTHSPTDKPVLKFTFDKPYTIPGVFIQWDAETNSCPNSITVYGYDATGGKTYTLEVNNITSVSGFYETLAMDDVQSIELVINDWKPEAWRARIAEIVFGMKVVFDSTNNGRITGATLTDKADPMARSLPTHTAKLTLRNIDKNFDPMLQEGISQYLTAQQLMTLKWGFVTAPGQLEWSPDMIYLVENFDIPPDSKDVTMNVTSRLGLLTVDFKQGNFTGQPRSLASIAEYIMERSNIAVVFDGQRPWAIDPAMESIMTTAPIPAMATNALLQLLAAAGMTWLTTRTTDGFIWFKKTEATVSPNCAIAPLQELGDPAIKVADRLRSIKVAVYSYVQEGATQDLGSTEYMINGTKEVEIKYTSEYATNVSASVSGATVKSQEYFASYAVLKLKTTSDAKVTVKLRGNPLEATTSYYELYRDLNVATGLDLTINNPFITTLEHAQMVADYTKNYYLKHGTYSVPYIGYPQLEAGDRISMETVYGSGEYDVVGNTIDFNGAWNGKAEVI